MYVVSADRCTFRLHSHRSRPFGYTVHVFEGTRIAGARETAKYLSSKLGFFCSIDEFEKSCFCL